MLCVEEQLDIFCQSTERHWKLWAVARRLLPCDTGSGNCPGQSHEKTSYLKHLPHRVPFQYFSTQGFEKGKKKKKKHITANARGKIAN